jgi:hypothetical protein
MPKQSTYYITVSDVVTRYRHFEIKADSEEDAIERIKEGSADAVSADFDPMSSIIEDEEVFVVTEVITSDEE